MKKHRTSILAVITLLAIILLVISACTPAPASAPSPATTTSSAPTPTSAPAPKPSPTIAPNSAPTTTPAAWQPVWKDGKLQPLADGFPSSPITVWNMFTPGHGDEIYARAVLAGAQDMSPVPFAVEAGNIGPRLVWGMLERFETLPRYKDGYHIAAANIGAMAVHYWTQPRGKWTIDNVNFIIGTDVSYYMITVRKDAPWNTMQQLADYSKANPGKVRVASSAGSASHINVLYLTKKLGINWTVVPMTAANAMLTLIGGGIEVVPYNPGQVIPFIDQVKVLAILFSGEGPRPGSFPDVPTANDLKIGMPGGGGTGRGFFTHPGVPATHVQWLYELLKAASLKQPYHDYLITFGQELLFKDHKVMQNELRDGANELGPVIQEMGLAVKQ